MRVATDVMAATPASRSATAPTPAAARIAAPRTADSPDRRDRDRHAQDVGLDPRPGVARRTTAGEPELADRRAGRGQRFRHRTHRERRAFQDRASQLGAAVGQREPDERAACRFVEQRRPLAREVRQEQEPARAQEGPAAASGASAPRPSAAPARTDSRSQSTDAPRAAIAPPTTHRPGSGAGAANRPGHGERPVRQHREPPDAPPVSTASPGAIRPAPSMRRRAVVHAGHDRDARPEAELRGDLRAEQAQRRAEREWFRAPVRAGCRSPQRRRRRAASRGPGPTSPPRRDSHSPSASQLGMSQRAWAAASGSARRQPGHPRQQPEPAVARTPVLPRDRRSQGIPGIVDHGQGRALAHAAHREHLHGGVRQPVDRPARGRRRRATSHADPAPPGRRAPASSG